MSINSYPRCELCEYAQYLANGQVGCYEENPRCLVTIAFTQQIESKLKKKAEQNDECKSTRTD